MSSPRDGQQISAARPPGVSGLNETWIRPTPWRSPGCDRPSGLFSLVWITAESYIPCLALSALHWPIRRGAGLVNQSYILFIGQSFGHTSSCPLGAFGGFLKPKQMWFLSVKLRVMGLSVSTWRNSWMLLVCSALARWLAPVRPAGRFFSRIWAESSTPTFNEQWKFCFGYTDWRELFNSGRLSRRPESYLICCDVNIAQNISWKNNQKY